MDNAPDPRPVYEADQVFTVYDVVAIRNGYIYQYHNTPFYEFQKRLKFQAGVGVCNELLHWLYHGKPANGMECKGRHNDANGIS